jgi:hypothetical protein
LANQLAAALGERYNARVALAKSSRGSAVGPAWQLARADMARIAAMQDAARASGSATFPGPDPATVARELAKCDAALTPLRRP